jgi:hypothetical protein
MDRGVQVGGRESGKRRDFEGVFRIFVDIRIESGLGGGGAMARSGFSSLFA